MAMFVLNLDIRVCNGYFRFYWVKEGGTPAASWKINIVDAKGALVGTSGAHGGPSRTGSEAPHLAKVDKRCAMAVQCGS